MLDIEFAELSDPGVLRDHNEDALGRIVPESEDDARTHGWLFAVADGVGGHDRGEVASALAIASVSQGFRAAPPGESLASILPRLVQAANTRVFEAALATGPAGSSMATTLVACALRYDRAVVSHVGDSRCCLIRQGYAVPLTRDHTVSGEQLRMGLISTRDASTSSASHVLSRAVGNDMFISVETSEHQIFAEDILLLCSDGLHHSVLPEDMAQHARPGADLREAARTLIELARTRDGSDNISVQLIRVRSVERVGMYRGRHYKLH